MKRGPGQPRKGVEVREIYSVRMEPSTAHYLRELANGNLSDGIAKAVVRLTKKGRKQP